MRAPFGSDYARTYDNVYAAKDYEAECDLLESIWKGNESPVQHVLDLGCGTGGHALTLASRGYAVTGVDRSPHMLEQARAKSREQGVDDKVSWRQGDIATIEIDATFDAVVMMFNVLGYQTTAEQVIATISTVRKHCRPGGLFIFDFWFGPAVLQDPPRTTFKQFALAQGELLRVSSGELDMQRQICNADIVAWHLDGDRVISKINERHDVRFFFAEELRLLLQAGGLKLGGLQAFPDIDEPAGASGWDAIGIATRVRTKDGKPQA